METKARYVTIGAFILISIAAAFGFVIWLAQLDLNTAKQAYDIYFEESVSGLSNSSAVLYKGVQVGNVRDIRIDPEDPERVQVTVEISEQTPIRQNAVATLAFQGITGVSNIEIEGGTADAAPLETPPGADRPVIPSKASALQELLGGAPDLLNEVSVLVDSLQRFADEENRKATREIINNINEITGGMALRAEIINRIIENMDTTMARMSKAAATLEETGQKTNRLLESDLPQMARNIGSAAQSIGTLAQGLDSVVESERGAVSEFTSDTLPEIGRMVEDARRLTKTLNRIADRIEENPSDFLFTPPPPEYRPQ